MPKANVKIDQDRVNPFLTEKAEELWKASNAGTAKRITKEELLKRIEAIKAANRL